MTQIYFVRHAQPDYRQGVDSTYYLSEEGMTDRLKAAEVLKNIHFDIAISSPYRRSIDTIQPIIDTQHLSLITDVRLRERDKGEGGNNHEMFRKRWADFEYHEEGGECLQSVQNRNIAALTDILKNYQNKIILIGTHGTALSTIINYYDSSFLCDGFMRIINYMPYVIRFDFDNEKFIKSKEIFFIEKDFHGVKTDETEDKQ